LIRIAISTLGCKINQAESAAIIDQFTSVQVVDWHDDADIYIINTCTVTNRTDYKSRNLIRQALANKLANPMVKIVVTGCFAQRSAGEIAQLGDVDFVIDNQQKLDIAAIIAGKEYHFEDIMSQSDFAFMPTNKMHNHTRAFQKIQDGCDFYCSYCAVPYARGHARSATLPQVLQQAKAFVESGYKEIVLGGVNLGLYQSQGIDLSGLLNHLSAIEGLELIRLSSIEPQLFSDKLIKTLQHIPQLCPHFHFPLQSGSNTILAQMHRHYDTAYVYVLLAKLIKAFPNAAIGLDVITGFPGETETEHNDTAAFLQTLPLAYLHVFSYSKRKGTPAAMMPHQVTRDVKTQRTSQLTDLSHHFQANYRQSLIDNQVVLRGVVETYKNGYSEAVSDHYLRLKVPENLAIGKVVQITASEACL